MGEGIDLEEFIEKLNVKKNSSHYAYLSFSYTFINDEDAYTVRDLLKQLLRECLKGNI